MRASESTPKANGRDRPNARGDATRQLILMKAEELFATHGIEAVPLRDIGVAAGQKNNVAVQYHFGDRDSLLREITTYRARASEQVRAEQLADLLADGRSPTVADLVRAWVLALASHLQPENFYLAFLARYVIEHGGYGGLEGTTSTSTQTSYTFTTMVRRLLPDHPAAVVEERWNLVMITAVHTLARYQDALRTKSLSKRRLGGLIDDLVMFLAAGLEAPLPVS